MIFIVCFFSRFILTAPKLMNASAQFAMRRHPKERYTAPTMVGSVATAAGLFSGEPTKKQRHLSFVASKVTVLFQ